MFKIETGLNIAKEFIKDGNVPRITVTATDNGVNSFTDISVNNEFRVDRNCVSISFLGNCFYHPYLASYDMRVHRIRPRNKILNRHIGLFLANLCNIQFKNTTYGNQLSSTDLRKKKILLPVAADGSPDWVFMENYMKREEARILREYAEFLRRRQQDNKTTRQHFSLKSREWKTFYLYEIFDEIERGKRLKTDDHIGGGMAYVSSSATDNGVDNFISNEFGVRIFENCLAIANSGSVGATFYHPYKFVASDHVTKLKKKNCNKYAYLFLSRACRSISSKYGFNHEINDKRIKREKIMLPVADDGSPDWAFMEGKMHQIEAAQIEKIDILWRLQ